MSRERVSPEPVYVDGPGDRTKEAAFVIDNVLMHPELDAMDRGPCQELDTETMARCTGRRISHREHSRTYKTRREEIFIRDFVVVWICDKCGYRRVL